MMRYGIAARAAAGLLAAIGWLGLGLYLVAEATASKGDWLVAVWNNLGFLTDLSNLILAVVMTGVALNLRRLSEPHVVGWAVVAIVTVGVGFWLIGGRLVLGTSALENILLHGVTPLAGLVFWLVFTPKGELRRRTALLWLAWPAFYWTYAMVRGAVSGQYAYGFLDPRTQGAGGVAAAIAGMAALYVVASLVLLGLDRAMGRKR
ncbi:Pr6Pr family membrane protein [Brevundimonas sp.]|jgi:hypothetical protein|uniref:Pr6Pr family membrane protein n=1 Tax=Brevundimonas sp. TaxID=1871086 RepID=UPI0037BE26DF